jgi:hypothetical protein
MTIESTYHFGEVFQEEVQQINQRRRELGRTDLVALEIEPDAVSVPANTVSSEPTS